MANTTYLSAKLQRVQKESSIRLVGKLLETNAESSILNDGRKDSFIAVGLCLCVHDSPENPCPCSGPIIWIPTDKLIGTGKIESNDKEVKYYFDISADATLYFEELVPFTASDYKSARSSLVSFPIGNEDLSKLLKELMDLLRTPPYVPIPDDKDPVSYSILNNLRKAFATGWAIGKLLDKEFKLSDKIADALCKADPDCE